MPRLLRFLIRSRPRYAARSCALSTSPVAGTGNNNFLQQKELRARERVANTTVTVRPQLRARS